MNQTLEQKLKHYKITHSEFYQICRKLGRPPKGLEWPLFSALWSEHCSYKSSKVHLRKLFSQSKRVLESIGENAGIIDLGQGERIAFKMESHNHPSYIEPTQGAATGVGGILRDVFTMGARPIALANYLCFGDLTAHRMPQLIDGVVRGIGGYGNCVGVPTITGQTEFHSSYNNNILVNALALGLFRPGEKILTSKACGVGNLVVYVGAQTGRDGIHGASMASGSFDNESEKQKPTVQIGDPFFEKLLIESCLEAASEELIVAIQDMGAAGLASSSFEMASKGGVGLILKLDQVPLRQASMTPEEILLSESQERMLLICRPKDIAQLQGIFEKWSLKACVIGEVTSNKMIQLFWKGKKVCCVNPAYLVEQAPIYNRPYKPWESKRQGRYPPPFSQNNLHTLLLQTLSDKRGVSREWIYSQFDQRVGGATVKDASESIGVICLPDSKRGLALVLGCRPHLMRFDACEGGKDAIAYPCIELASKGFEPMAVTDCLNFGNPERSDVMSEFVVCVESLNQMCKALQIPIISGNVSFYNETMDHNITPTPTTGIVGLRKDVYCPSSFFKNEGDLLFLLSSLQLQVSGLLFENKTPMVGQGEIDPKKTCQFVKSLMDLSQECPIQSSRIVGKFGLAYALGRMSTPHLGCYVPDHRNWFIENLYEVIVSVKALDQELFLSKTKKLGLKTQSLGVVTTGILQLGGTQIDCKEIQKAYRQTPFQGCITEKGKARKVSWPGDVSKESRNGSFSLEK